MTVLPACGKDGEPARQAEVNSSTTVENTSAAVPLPRPPMDRAALLQAVALARSAAAAGADDLAAQKALDGKEFELRIRFGCAGASAGGEKPSLSWSIDSRGGVLRIRAAPDLSSEDGGDVAEGLEGIEAVEGFWIPRPWLLQAACPANPSAPSVGQDDEKTPVPADSTSTEPAAVAAKVGIAQFFTARDPRTARRGHRPYEAVRKLEPGASVGNKGFDLVLSGRLSAFPDGRVISCTAIGPDSPPDCIVSGRFDHVWIDDAATGERIADWSSS